MISTLADLAAPLTEAEFLAMLRGRALRHLRGAMTPAHAALLDWPALRVIIEQGNLPAHKLRVSHNARVVEPPLYRTDGKVDPARLDDLLARGVSIVVSELESRVPAFGMMCGNLRVRLRERMTAHAIVTTGTGGAFAQHYDSEDILVLQIEGSKRWQIHAATRVHPVKGDGMSPPPDGAPLFDQALEQGDILFIPAGFWHRCENGAERSLHISIGFEAFTGWDAVAPLLRQLQYDDDFRMPLTRGETEADRDALEARLKARVIAKIGELSLRDFLSNET